MNNPKPLLFSLEERQYIANYYSFKLRGMPNDLIKRYEDYKLRKEFAKEFYKAFYIPQITEWLNKLLCKIVS